MAGRKDIEKDVPEFVSTPSKTTTQTKKPLEKTVLEATAEPGGLTEGKLLNILNQALPDDRQVSIETTTPGQRAKIEAPLSKVYTNLNYTQDVVITEQVTTDGIFPSSVGSITDGAFYTSSNQTSTSKGYYYTVSDGTTTSSIDLFDVAWGGISASLSASHANYKQVANLLLDRNDYLFTFSGSTDAHSVFVISFKRSRYLEKINPGTWEFKVAYSSALAGFVGTASFTDDSNNGAISTKTTVGERVNIVSGTIGSTISTDVRGHAYTDLGLLILDGDYFSSSLGLSGSLTFVNSLDKVQARSERRLKDLNYFCRVFNKEFNYSNNPTFVTGSAGDYRFSTFKTEPHVFVTTIGLYNDDNELLAIAKLSKPSEKTFSKEAVYDIRLSW